ncbi:MAG TPA: hypothetical protein VMT20_16845 [Terriglobia bacterium]|nr:hypothetical protein [Terriglobia bacterium]
MTYFLPVRAAAVPKQSCCLTVLAQKCVQAARNAGVYNVTIFAGYRRHHFSTPLLRFAGLLLFADDPLQSADLRRYW